MKRVLDISEVLGQLETPDGQCEICAAADASYDERSEKLVINLISFLRTTDLRTKERKLPCDWLPKPENLRENVGSDEAGGLARDIFHRWVQKVRRTTSLLHSFAV